MKLSELVRLKKGVFLLEAGAGKRDPRHEVAIIQFANCMTELDPQRSENEDEICFPLPLEDHQLRTLKVGYEGLYIDPTRRVVGELPLVVSNYLPKMLIGQKVLIIEGQACDSKGMVNVVKLLGERSMLSEHEHIVLDLVHVRQPRTEDDWSEVNTLWTNDIWRDVFDSDVSSQSLGKTTQV